MCYKSSSSEPSIFSNKTSAFSSQPPTNKSSTNEIQFPPFNQNDKSCSSFKQVKVYYCDNTNQGKNIFKSEIPPEEEVLDINQVEEPTIFHLESFRPKTKMIQRHNLITSNRTCTCTKTKCMKKYCECLANNQFCYNCSCIDCHNIPAYQQEKTKENTEKIICTCTKSNCNKKYCECYKSGRKCNSSCRCLNCQNRDEKKDKYEDYIVERISVFIDRGVISIEKKDITNDLLNRKRERDMKSTENDYSVNSD